MVRPARATDAQGQRCATTAGGGAVRAVRRMGTARTVLYEWRRIDFSIKIRWSLIRCSRLTATRKTSAREITQNRGWISPTAHPPTPSAAAWLRVRAYLARASLGCAELPAG